MRKLAMMAATFLAAGVFGSVSAQTITYTVDCAKGQTISGAIARGDNRKPLIVKVRGACNEAVAIERNDVTLRGDPAAWINAPDSGSDVIYITGNGTTLENLTLTGGLVGVRVEAAVRTTINNCVIQDSSSNGIHVFIADVRVTGSTIQRAGNYGVHVVRGASAALSLGSQVLDNANAGINVGLNSTVTANGTTISGNGSHGVQVEGGSQGTFTSSVISGNGTDANRGGAGISVSQAATVVRNSTVSNNRTDGVIAVAGATVGADNNTITGNGDNGVFGYLGPTLVLQGNEIAYNGTGVACRADCTMQIAGANIHDNATHAVVVMLDSRAIFQAPVTTATPNGWVDLWCGDSKSSVDGVDGLSYDGGDFFDGSVSPTCVGFSD